MKLPLTLILTGYGIIPVIVPHLGAWDSNGTKFLFLAMLNFISFFYLLNRNEIKSHSGSTLFFFRRWVGLTYTLFLFLVLISFTKAISPGESLLSFSKYFTGFMAAWIVSIIIRTDSKYLYPLSIAMSILLLIDCITVFFNILAYINGNISSITEIKSVYSNKNILTSAIFVKIPFSLWLISFCRNRDRTIGFIAFFMALGSILFLSTRAFYLGIILLTFLFLVFQVIRFKRGGEGKKLVPLFIFIGLLISGITFFSVIQFRLFSKLNKEEWNTDVLSRLGSINEESSSGRMAEWKMTAKLIKEDPLLGVGTGNWKMSVLKYENPASDGFVFLHFNHNDFLQITAETGIPGGILFISLFILIGYFFIAASFRKEGSEEAVKYLFIPAFGLLAYSVDAFFNFPGDRSEMVALFALFIGSGVALTPSIVTLNNSSATSEKFRIKRHYGYTKILHYFFLLLMAGTVYILYLNYQSLKFQMLVVKDLLFQEHKLTYEELEKKFPSLPVINAVDEPIALIKSRYLIFEERYSEAIDLLKKDKSSPFYARNEFFLGLSYEKTGDLENALVHYMNAYRLKPRDFDFLYSIGNIYQKQGRRDKAMEMIDQYLKNKKMDSNSWGYAADLYFQSGDIKKAILLTDSGLKYRPDDGNLLKQKNSMERLLKIKPFESIYNSAIVSFQEKDFVNAQKLFSDFISKKPGFPEAYEYRSSCYYQLKQYKNCISDIEKVLSHGNEKASLYNLRGAAYINIGEQENGCRDFKKAMEMGDTTASENLRIHCLKQQ